MAKLISVGKSPTNYQVAILDKAISKKDLLPAIKKYQKINKVKFIEGEKNNFKITDQTDLDNLKNVYKFF